MIDLATVAALPLFRGLTADALGTLARHGVERSYEAGATLFRAGDTPWGLLILLAGRVRVIRTSGSRTVVVHSEGPGGSLAEVPLFAGGTLPGTAVALEPTRCLIFERDALRGAMTASPDVAFALLGRLAERIRGLVERLDRLSSSGVSARLAGYLLELHDGQNSPQRAARPTQAQIAEELGTVREVIVRELRALRGAGVIRSLRGGRIEILDAAALRQMSFERSTS